MSADRGGRAAPPNDDEPPPFGGSWKRIYTAVVVYTFLVIALLYAMSVALDR